MLKTSSLNPVYDQINGHILTPKWRKSSLVLQGVKNTKYLPKIISQPNCDTYECNYLHVYTIYMWAYDNRCEFGLK